MPSPLERAARLQMPFGDGVVCALTDTASSPGDVWYAGADFFTQFDGNVDRFDGLSEPFAAA
jgi:hypothetical protein